MNAVPAGTGSADEPQRMALRITRKEPLTRDIQLFELRRPDGAPLPSFTPGAHLSVLTPMGAWRKYSLCNDPLAGREHYRIAVKREPAGRGGSISMLDETAVGDPITAEPPCNHFELAGEADSFIFIAGGIGITPLLCMARNLLGRGKTDFHLYYLTRDAGSTAFRDELLQGEFGRRVTLHHDSGDPGQAFDFWPILETPTAAHIYCCGPRGLMDGVRDMCGHWPAHALHFESFGIDAAARAEDRPFEVELRKTSTRLQVGAHESMLDALRRSGLAPASSCESGTCGACRTRLVSGLAEHRDMVLTPEERSDYIMPCVSRAQSGLLVLDL